jgi:hypothetical protein
LRRAQIEQVVSRPPILSRDLIGHDFAQDRFGCGYLPSQTWVSDHGQHTRRCPPLTGPQFQSRDALMERPTICWRPLSACVPEPEEPNSSHLEVPLRRQIPRKATVRQVRDATSSHAVPTPLTGGAPYAEPASRGDHGHRDHQVTKKLTPKHGTAFRRSDGLVASTLAHCASHAHPGGLWQVFAC